jgi:hypothetical protein
MSAMTIMAACNVASFKHLVMPYPLHRLLSRLKMRIAIGLCSADRRVQRSMSNKMTVDGLQ